MGIKNWDSNPDNNNAAPPAGAPEGTTLISDLNNIARQIMGDVRAWYELQWTDLGLALEATGGANAIVLTGDQSQYFEVNQRVQFLDGGGTKVATITGVSVATNTTLTVSVAVTHPVSQLWNGIKPSLIPAILTADIIGDVTGDVTGNLDGIHASGSIASGVTGVTQAADNNSQELATTEYADRAANASPGFGEGQTWQDVAGSRAIGTEYTNDTGRTIAVSVSSQTNEDIMSGFVGPTTANVEVARVHIISSNANQNGTISNVQFLVPPGHRYRVTNNFGSAITVWAELR